MDKPQSIIIQTNPKWPAPLKPEAFHGLAGTFVKLVEPFLEADPAALLIQFLTAVGNLVGKGPHFLMGATKHFLNLFSLIIGDTSKARKGTSWDPVEKILSSVDPDFKKFLINGLSSGEGLISIVADGSSLPIANEKKCLVMEGEFSSPLKVMKREGNTLSPVIRNCWDGKILRIANKNSPLKASNAHVSIIGHITTQEITKFLKSIETVNGFANRFLFCMATRSKFLPLSKVVESPELSNLQNEISLSLKKAKQITEIIFSLEAEAYWFEIFKDLSAGKPGLFGAAIARSEPQTIRIACIYAVLDGSNKIEIYHLKAALAVWEYCEASALYIFGELLTDPKADRILEALESNPSGLNRTEIHGLFGKNERAENISRALHQLQESGLAFKVSVPTNGRSIELWKSTKYGTKETN